MDNIAPDLPIVSMEQGNPLETKVSVNIGLTLTVLLPSPRGWLTWGTSAHPIHLTASNAEVEEMPSVRMDTILFPYGKEKQNPGADDFPIAEGRTRGKKSQKHLMLIMPELKDPTAFHGELSYTSLCLLTQRRASQVCSAIQPHTWQKLSMLLPYFEKIMSFPSTFS